jgi:hypothetical protein
MAISFDDLDFEPRGFRGIQARTEFDNGYGASVVKSTYSYGGSNGFYELAVTADGRLCYDTPITDDVVGYLTPGDVTELLGRIAELPRRKQVSA